jgi:hypothetical protein
MLRRGQVFFLHAQQESAGEPRRKYLLSVVEGRAGGRGNADGWLRQLVPTAGLSAGSLGEPPRRISCGEEAGCGSGVRSSR